MDGRDRTRLLTFVVVVLVISSIGLVSATIDSVAVENATTGGFEQQSDSQSSDRGGADFAVDGSEGSGDGTQEGIDLRFCVGLLQSPVSVAGIVGGIMALGYLVFRRYNAATAGLVSAGVIPVVMFSYFLLTNCQSSGPDSGALLDGSDVMSGSGSAQSPALPPWALAVAFGGVAVLAVGLIVRATGAEERVEVAERGEDDPEVSEFAEAAGRAADRIEETNAEVDNAVYRAWLEMTGLLDLENAESASPLDFAEAAVDTGLREDDVAELTDLFTEVRYGGKSPEGREDDALSVLRTIEQTYQDADDVDGGET